MHIQSKNYLPYILKLSLIVISTEYLLMLTFQGLQLDKHISPSMLAVLDACLLLSFAAAPVYYWVIRPIIQSYKQTQQDFKSLISALDGASNSVMITNSDGYIEYVNQAFSQLTGYSRGDIIGQNPSILQSGKQDKAFYTNMWNSILHTGEWQGELWNKRKNGEEYLENLHIKAIQDQHGQVQSYIGMISDITLKKQKEARQLQTQRLASIGTLVGGVAHNFNNLLAAIIGQIYLAKNSKDKDSLSRFLNNIEDASFQAADIVKQLLLFSRSHDPEKKNIALIPLIQSAVNTANLDIPKDIQLNTEFTDDKLMVFCDPNAIQQLMINIINNARDAVCDQKVRSITLSVDQKAWSASDTNDNCEVCSAHTAHISITDSGVGIRESDLKNIFDPFFSTKDPGKGTGLGLSTAYSTVQAHDGHISVSSKLGQGTQFEICLPCNYIKEASPTNTSQAVIQKASKPATILITDDEEVIRNTLSLLLNNLGYQTLTACHGEEAIEMVAKHPEIDILITDIVMPIMDGITAANKISEKNPDLPILFISGYDKSHHANNTPIKLQNTIQKPFNVIELSHEIHAMLETKDT